MLLARFRPLNSDSEDDSKCEDDIPTNTKEALEEKARSQYMKALTMVRDGKLNDAETELIQLIESEVLTKTTGKVTFIAGRIKPSLEHLKYCCYLNLGHVYFQKEDLERAFYTYREALNLDDTDLNLLYKIGLVAMKMGHIDVAIEALEAALERSPNHWPSLDNLIVALYAGGGLVNCLYYISTALERDPGYGRGLAFRERIFKNHPTLKEHYNMFYPENQLDPEAKCNLPEELKDKYYSDVENLIKKRREQAEKTKKIPKPTPEYRIPYQPKSWQQLGVIILNAKKQFSAELLEQNFFRPMNLLFEEDPSNCPLEMEVEVEEGEGDEDDDVDKINNEGSGNENEDVTENLGVRVKRRRSSPTYLDQWMSGKRRSARVRSTIRKEEPSLARTLTDLTPSSLLQPKNESKKEETFRFDDSMDTMDLYRLFENKEDDSSVSCNNKQVYYNISTEERENIIKQEEYFGSNQESRDVSDFLHKHNRKHIKDLFEAYSIALASKWNLHWSSNLISHYMTIFRLYMSHNLRRCAGHNYEISFELAKAVVLFSELALSQWVESGRSKGKPNPIGEGLFGGEIPLLYLGDLRLLSPKIEDKEFISRCWWVESLLYLYRGDIIGALHSFETYLADERIESTEVKLYNMSIHYLINKNMVEGMVSSLTRKEMLLEVLNLYKEDNYEQMAELLCQVLKPDEHKVKLHIFQAPIDRHAQFNMLLEAYWNLKNYEECLKWGEIYLTEALNHYRGVLNLEECVTERSKWCDIISNTLHLMLCSIDEFGLSLMKVLEQSRKIRLVQSLMQTICHQVEALDTDVCIETTATWILLYLVIKYEEKNINSGEEVLPRSLQILFTAHEYLGRRAWCCMDDAAILYQTLKELKSLMDVYPSGSDMMLVLVQQLEQIFYCLYGHPIKRNKPRYIQEHNVDGLALTWERSFTVFNFLRPKELPTYDSSSRLSISADTEVLFKRIVGLVPAECNPARLVDAMTQYIESANDTIPTNNCALPAEMADIYYLIADFSFKNKAWGKALRYYLLDVCNNPERVDSWACLALARGSQLETKLNSCDPLKSELVFIKKAVMSCRCYKTSLDIDPGLSTLWIEYGSFSYMVHSFCSRMLKQEQNLSLEMFEVLETNKDGMLATALTCFTSANNLWYSENGVDMQDERWLHHYMLGKISEKKQESPNVYLDHYIKSMEFLHQNKAMYPLNISYSTPQNLAVEALEVFYRINVCILKNLEQYEDRPLELATRKLYKKTLEKLSSMPFFTDAPPRNPENKNEDKESLPDNDSVMSTVHSLVDNLIEKVVLMESQIVYLGPKSQDDTLSDKRISRNNSTESEISKASKSDSKSLTKQKSTDSSSQSTSSSSSDSDSSSDSSSDDDSDETTTESSQQDNNSESKETADSANWKQEQDEMITTCIQALEECARRFTEHYKSLYRMAHFYFRSKRFKDVNKVHSLLLGPQGLFADRKPTNFFNGVWRIPSNEIDRPGSFASHMSRCVLLLLDVLRESKDSKMLLDLSLQLRDTPEPDKKYLRDTEREELCREALSLSAQALRKKLQEAKSSEDLKEIVLQAFKYYRKMNKAWSQREGPFVLLLTDAFSKYSNIKEKTDSASILDAAIKFSAQELMAIRAAASGAPPPQITTPAPVLQTTPSTSSPQVITKPFQPKPPTIKSTPAVASHGTQKRPRGRPSNVSLRQMNPSSIHKQNFQTKASEMAALYRNMANFSDSRMLMQASTMMAAKAAMSQWQNYQAELMRLSLNSLTSKPSTSNFSITPVPPQKYPLSNTTRPSTSLTPQPTKINIPSPNQPAMNMMMNKTAVQSKSNTISQRPGPAYQKSKPPMTQSPAHTPVVSLQHKLFAKRSKAMSPKPDVSRSPYITTTAHTTPKTVSSSVTQPYPKHMTKEKPLVIELDKDAAKLPQGRDLMKIVKSVNEGKFTGTGPSGISISKIQVKPPEIKTPKDSVLSISPVSSLKNVISSLSPKEVTVTALPAKPIDLKSGNSVTLSYVGSSKKPEPTSLYKKYPSTSRNETSKSTVLTLGKNVTITPTSSKTSKPKDNPKTTGGYDLILLE